jgi:hypothetical protein
MVLPDIQALFGFQLVAVFEPSFFELLSPVEQTLHLLALTLTAIAIAFVMTPAAFHHALPGLLLSMRTTGAGDLRAL